MSHRLASLASVILLLPGCATFVDGERATDDALGIEYSLPVPIVRVTPQANGTMDVKVEYLPDPENTYVLRTRSLISSYTLDVQRENGLLKSVSLDSKSDAVAAAAAEAAGKLVEVQSAVEAKEQEGAAATAKEQAKALSDAQLAVAAAQARLDTLEAAQAGTDKLLDAKIALAEAKAKRDLLLGAATGTGSSFNAPGTAAPPLEAAAPVLFRVVPDGLDGIKLVAFEGPRRLPTSTAAKPQETVPELALTLEGSGVLTTGQPLQFKLLVNRRVASVDLSRSKLIAISAGAVDRSSFVLAANPNPVPSGATIIVTLRTGIPQGTYSFTPVMVAPDGQPMMADPITITVAS
jgi:hypothetical protein